jgi:hypothetical protein
VHRRERGESPWPPLATELGLPPGTDAVSALLLRTCEFVDTRHTDDAQRLLRDIADTAARTGAAIGPRSSAGLILGVEHAQLLAGAGLGKADVQRWVYDHAVRSRADLAAAGKDEGRDDGGGMVHLLPAPEQIPIVVAGARNAAMSMVVRPFGFSGWSRTAHPVHRP